MTRHVVLDTSSTSQELQQTREVPPGTSASTSSERNASYPKPGMVLAGLFLWAALATISPTPTAPVGPFLKRRDEFSAESSTADVERSPELLNQAERIFEQGASEFFQDGMYSNFSRSLLAFLKQYGRAAFQAIAEYVFSGTGKADVTSEALRWLADYDDPATLPQRWAILQRTIKDHSPRIRDGAILGFAALDDPRARGFLLQTMESEPIPELRRLIQQVVDQLNATHAATPSER